MSFFEALMLVCFGVSWPISIVKTLRTGIVQGKSPLFMTIVCLGYLSGIAHKLLVDCDWVTFLYTFNLLMVAVDLTLYFWCLSSQPPAAAGGCAEPGSPWAC